MMLTFPGFLLFASLANMEGLIAYAYFVHTECDPLDAGFVKNANQILPYFVMELFRKRPGVPGLFLASLFSASLSTLSSGLSSMSAVLWSDYFKRCLPNASEFTATLITKSTVIVLGMVTIGIAFLVMQVGGPLNQISSTITNSIDGPLTGIFVLGALFPSATAKGAVSGAVIAFGVIMWIAWGASFSPLTVKTPYLPPASTDKCYASLNTSFGATRNMTEIITAALDNFTTAPLDRELSAAESFLSYIYSLSYMWFGPISMFLSVVVGLIASHITGANPPGTIDPKYIIPVFDNLFCYLPRSVRNKLRYGKDFVPLDDGKKEELLQMADECDQALVIKPKSFNYDMEKGINENQKGQLEHETFLIT